MFPSHATIAICFCNTVEINKLIEQAYRLLKFVIKMYINKKKKKVQCRCNR